MIAVRSSPDGPWLCQVCLAPLELGAFGTPQSCVPCGGRAPAGASAPPGPPRGGPGTELSAILKDWFGIEPTPACSCRAMAAKMDKMGPDWCEGQGMQEILAVMRSEHAKRRVLLPWTDAGAAALVRRACRRARQKEADTGIDRHATG